MPKYSDGLGRVIKVDDLTLAASAARTATANGTEFELGDKSTMSLLLDVTAASGTTPTLDVTVETRNSASDTFRTVGTFAQKTTTSQERKSFAALDRYVRVRWTIAGTTPSFTFSVAGEVK